MERLGLRRALQSPRLMSTALQRSTLAFVPIRQSSGSSLPSIVQPSFWKSLIPKPFRRDKPQTDELINWGPPKKIKRARSGRWNPATFYIVIFLLIGSMSINMITLKKDFSTFMRRSETRIGLLKEVVERLQRGEEFDVEKALGTGDAEQEAEWDQVLKDISRDDSLRSNKKSDKGKQTSSKAEAPGPTTPAVEAPKSTSAGLANFF